MTASARIRSRAAVFKNGMFRLLFTATLGSAIGTYATTIALTADIDARTQSTWWVALLFLVTFMPRIFVGLFIGPLIDRLSRKTLIVGSDLVRLVVFALLPFAHHPATMIVLAAVSGSPTRSSVPRCSPVPRISLASGTSTLRRHSYRAPNGSPRRSAR